MSSPAPSTSEALAEGSRDGRDSPSRRKLALATGQRLKQMNQHHPYRIELLDLTPVSVSVLWSTHPSPLSAIPSGIATTPLRQRFQTRSLSNGTASPPPSSATASAVFAPPTSSSGNVKPSKLPHTRHQPLSSEASSSAGSARASPTPGSSQDAPMHRLAEGLIATRSLNRKVTKIRLRGPASVPAASGRRASNGSATLEGRIRAIEDGGLGSDDATTGIDDDGASGSEGSDSGFEGDSKASNMVSVFEKRVSVTVNGSDWPHVLMGERGSHEAIVVIFGLQTESDYDVQFEVKAGLDGTPENIRLPVLTKADRDRNADLPPSSRGVVSTVIGSTTAAVRPNSPSPLGKTAVSADGDSEVINVQKKALLQAELEASEGMKSDVLAELRKARKETSKAESALRNDIESIKRHIDRMSSTDHRSKQKVLALQEAIKQTTAHVKAIHDEVEEIEGELDDWEKQEATVTKELEELSREVDAEDAEVEAQLQGDEAEIAAVEKELKAAEAALRSKEADRDGLQNEKLPALEAEISKLQSQIKVLSKPLHARRGGHASAVRGGGRGSGSSSSSSNHMIPSQALPRGGGKGLQQGLGYPSGPGGGRGGKALHGHNARAASGPAAQGGYPTGPFQGFKTSVSGGAQGNIARAYRSSNNLRPDGGAGSISIHAPFNPTATEPPYPSGFSHMHSQERSYGGLQSAGFGSMGGGGIYGWGYIPDANADGHDYSAEPSPSGSERRSSLPLPQLFGKGTSGSVLNPNNQEFVPSASSANVSPVMVRETISELHGGKPASAVTSQPQPQHTFNPTPPVGASMEHSPTSSSRFAFPLARHGGAGVISKLASTSAAPSPIGSDRLPLSAGKGSASHTISTSSQLFPPGAGAFGAFSRGSPLLAGPATTASGNNPLMYGSNSPRFAPASFVNAPSLWSAPSPPLGGGLSMPGGAGDIWSPPSLPGTVAPSSLRTKFSLGDFGQRLALRPIGMSHEIGPDFGPGASSSSFLAGGSGFLGGGGGSRLMNMSAPVSPTSPHRPEHLTAALPPSYLEQQGDNRSGSIGESSDVEILAEIAKALTAEQARTDVEGDVDVNDADEAVAIVAASESKGADSPPTPSFADVAAAAKTSS